MAFRIDDETAKERERALFKCCKCSVSLGSGAAPFQSKLLPCLHPLCNQCFHVETSGRGSAVCPKCSFRFGPKDATDHVMPLLNKNNRCQGCQSNQDAIVVCQTCKEALCSECVDAHRRVTATRNHVITEIANASQRIVYCPKHLSERLVFFCDTCQKVTCKICQLSDHKGHTTSKAEDAAAQGRIAFSNTIEKNNQRLLNLHSSKNVVQKRLHEIEQIRNKFKTQLESAFLQLQQALTQRCMQLLQEFETAAKLKQEEYQRKESDIDRLTQMLRQAQHVAQGVLASGNATVLLDIKRMLIQHLLQVQSIQFDRNTLQQQVQLQVNIPQQQLGDIYNRISHFGQVMLNATPFYTGSEASPPMNHGQTHSTMVTSVQPTGPSQLAALVRAPAMTASTIQQQQQQQQKHQLQPRSNIVPPPYGAPVPAKSYTSPPLPQSAAVPPLVSATAATHGGGPPPLRMGVQTNVRAPGMQPPHTAPMTQEQRPQLLMNTARPPALHQLHAQSTPGACSNIRPPPLRYNPPPQPQSHSQPVYQQLQAVSQATMNQAPTVTKLLQNPAINALPTCSVTVPQNGLQECIIVQSAGGNVNQSQVVPVPVHVMNGHLGVNDQQYRPTVSQVQDTHISTSNSPQGARKSVSNSKAPKPTGPHKTLEQVVCSLLPQPPSTGGTEQQTAALPQDRHVFGSISAPNNESNDSNDVVVLESPNDQSDAKTSKEATVVENQPSPASLKVILSRTSEGTYAPAPSGTDNATNERHTPEALKVTTTTSMASRIEGSGAATTSHSSDDWCAVCQNGVDVDENEYLVCCDGCPRVYHLECHVPMLPNVPLEESWVCTLCQDPKTLQSELDGETDANAANRKRKHGQDEELTPYERKICQKILLRISCHDVAAPFRTPVPRKYGHYYRVIRRPMDFQTMNKRLDAVRRAPKHYKSVAAFITDMNRVLKNCSRFNEPESEVAKAGRTLLGIFKEHVSDKLPNYSGNVWHHENLYRPHLSDDEDETPEGTLVSIFGPENGPEVTSTSGDEESARKKARRSTSVVNSEGSDSDMFA